MSSLNVLKKQLVNSAIAGCVAGIIVIGVSGEDAKGFVAAVTAFLLTNVCLGIKELMSYPATARVDLPPTYTAEELFDEEKD